SSGSVLAQKLLFAHSFADDLSSYIEAYFDTTTGPKREAASYRKIAATLQLRAEQVLFISDLAPELDAARAAHAHTALCLRPGNPQPELTSHPAIRTFDEVLAA